MSRVADVLPLAPAQEGLLYHALFDDHVDAYLVRARFAVAAPVRGQAIRDALAGLLDRYPNLRACFRHKGLRRPVQVIPDHVPIPVTEIDLSTTDDPTARLEAVLADDLARRFDVTRPPLVRAMLVLLPDGRGELVLTLHHLLVDGWSMAILAGELDALYAGRDLPAAPSYRDYLAWLREQDGEVAAKAWQQALTGLDRPTLLVPGGAENRPVRPETLDRGLPDELGASVRARAVSAGVTVNTLVQVAWALVLGRQTDRTDVVFGAVMSGRSAALPGVESMVGLFLNTLPVRIRWRTGESVVELLARVQAEQVELIEHQHARLSTVQRLAGLCALFDTVLAFENFPRGKGNSSNLSLVDTLDGTHYPLSLAVVAGDRIVLRAGFRPDVLDRSVVVALLDRFEHALRLIAEHPDESADRLDVLPAAQREALLAGSRGPVRTPAATAIPARFGEIVARVPDAVAVECADTRLTYAELDRRSDAQAARLAASGVRPGTAVGVLLPRSAGLVVALLAVLKTGAHYVPVDPDQPADRIATLLRAAGVRHVLDELPDSGGKNDPPRVTVRPHDIACVMYTSGSSGSPKGVAVTHANLLELADDRGFGTAHDRVLLHSRHDFDAVNYELWVPLLRGGTVVLAAPGPLDVAALRHQLDAGRIGAIFLTADLFRTIADIAPDTLSGLREVWSGGDVVSPEAVAAVRRACPDTTVVDGYGPTEATTFATRHVVSGIPSGAVPIGRPMDNTGTYLLDRALRPVPAGAVGELYLAGTGIAAGYVGRSARTAERFVANPFGPPGTRLYRTGDLARRNPSGDLEFAGRADDQVKVRGFRIEPAEVEAVLATAPGVRQAAVAARPGAGGKRLVGYLVLAAGGDLAAVRAHAAARLPRHLVPDRFVMLDRLPVTARGKVDRSALPDPDRRPATESTPRTPREERLCRLFATVLGAPAIGPEDGFFDAGGDSLLAVRLTAAIEAELGVRLPVGTLYEAPTPAGLSLALDRIPVTEPIVPPVLELRSGDRIPLWCMPSVAGLGWQYATLLPHLPADRPVLAVQDPAIATGEPFAADVPHLAGRYLTRIRARQPHGPYALLGWSFGGLVAYQIAARLRSAGEPVALLAVLDTIPFGGPDTPPDGVVEQETLRFLLRTVDPARVAGADRLTRAEVFAAVRAGEGPLRDLGDRMLARIADLRDHNNRIGHSYRPPAFDGTVLLFSATGEPGAEPSAAKAGRWLRTAAAVEVHDIACGHDDVLTPGPAGRIGAAIASALKEL